MKSSFHNSKYFRFFAPLVFGIIVYILILLIFDTINQLNENFFSFEVILCVFIAYLISEFNRIIIKLIEKYFYSKSKLTQQIVIQLALTSILVLFITSLSIAFYMHYLVGFKRYSTELIVFNAIYFTLNMCYNLLYFSILYNVKMGEIQISLAEQARKESEIELEAYKSKMNPELLNKSLEILICYAAKDPVIADEYISKISDFYRSILSNKRNELIGLENELQTAENYISIQNSWNNNNIILDTDFDESLNKYKIVPGTLYVFLEHVINNSIISSVLPLNMVCKTENKQLIIESFKKDKIQNTPKKSFEIERLFKAYKFYSDKEPVITDELGRIKIQVPLFS